MLVRTKNGFPVWKGMMDDFFNERQPNSWPLVNILKKENSWEIEIAAPGLSKTDFSLAVKEGVLEVKAEKQAEEDAEGVRYSHREFSPVNFTRKFRLPEDSDMEKIAANYSEGIIRIAIPAKLPEEPEVRKIEIS